MAPPRQNLKTSDDDRPAGAPPLKVVPLQRPPVPSIRSMCPFCGSVDLSPEAPCCNEWRATLDPPIVAKATEPGGLERWRTSAGEFHRRLTAASPMLVTLLASAMVATLVSLVGRTGPAVDRAAAEFTARIIDERVAAALDAARARDAEIARQVLAEKAAELPVPPPPAAEAEKPVVASVGGPVEIPPFIAYPSVVEPSGSAAGSIPSAMAKEETVAARLARKAPALARVTEKAPALRRIAAIPRAPETGAEPAADANVPPRPELAAPPASLSPELASRAAAEASAPWGNAPPPARTDAVSGSAWRALHRGLSRAEVQKLLGAPKWKREVVGSEIWLYEESSLYSNGWVAFSETEGLSGWRLP